MVKEIVEYFANDTRPLCLQVRNWNAHAIHIYQKAGFIIVEETKHFDIYEMTYIRKEKN